MKKRRYSAGGGVPTTGGMYDAVLPQYPFPSSVSGETGTTTNTSIVVNGQDVAQDDEQNPTNSGMKRGGKVKQKRVRGDGIAQRGKTKGRFVR